MRPEERLTGWATLTERGSASALYAALEDRRQRGGARGAPRAGSVA
jgi:hypothetical protein